MTCIALSWKSTSLKEIATVDDGSAAVVVVQWALNAENCFGRCIDG